MDSIEQFGAEGLALAQVVALESVDPLPKLQDLLSMPERTTRAFAQSLTLSVKTSCVGLGVRSGWRVSSFDCRAHQQRF